MINEKFKKFSSTKDCNEQNINENIKAKKVRVVGENIKTDIYNIKDALDLAYSMSLDLVEISPNSDPPVCKIIDYSKYKYEQKKHREKIKANTREKIIKEIKLGPNMGEGDFNTKLKHAREFLKDKKSVKIFMQINGKFLRHKENGSILLNNFIEQLSDIGEKEYEIKTEGKKIYTVINPTIKK